MTAVATRVKDGMRQTAGTISVGDSFGQDCLQTPGNRRKLTVMARTDMVLLHMDKQDYLNIFVPEQLGDGVGR
jgi:CRP-like cAMP-binding protein